MELAARGATRVLPSISVLNERERHGGAVGQKSIGDDSVVTISPKIRHDRFRRISFGIDQIELGCLSVDQLPAIGARGSSPCAALPLRLSRQSTRHKKKA